MALLSKKFLIAVFHNMMEGNNIDRQNYKSLSYDEVLMVAQGRLQKMNNLTKWFDEFQLNGKTELGKKFRKKIVDLATQPSLSVVSEWRREVEQAVRSGPRLNDQQKEELEEIAETFRCNMIVLDDLYKKQDDYDLGWSHDITHDNHDLHRAIERKWNCEAKKAFEEELWQEARKNMNKPPDEDFDL